MKFQNISNQSYQFFPGQLENPNEPGSTIVSSKQLDGNKILFFEGVIPPKEELLTLTAENIETKGYKKLLETPEFGLTYTYNSESKKRYIRKTVIDALELQYLDAGTIGWAAILLNNPDSTVSYIIMTDTIGTWGDTTSPIIIDNKNGTLGSRNLFKSISIEITDKPNMI